MNQINVIHPYLWHGQWVFDDPDVGLLKEAFVAGADDVCDRLVEMVGLPGEDQFTLRFSKDKFPSTQFSFVWVGEGEGNGHYYYCGKLKLISWLCPALFRYFDMAPLEIHIQAKRYEVHNEQVAVG
jgi:hypothetical protein